MSKHNPLVSILIPSTSDRKEFNDRILKMMRAQDYDNKEIVFDYGPGKIGEKRNRLAWSAKGDIILQADSDDYYRSDWVSKNVEMLIGGSYDVVGMDHIIFCSEFLGRMWKYDPKDNVWISGATLCYWKKVWEEYPFRERQIGEDTTWMQNMPDKFKVHLHDYIEGFMASIHKGNTMGKNTDDKFHYTELSTFEVEKIIHLWGKELHFR
jgi:cellulose synthase/poly-beta-1,6-N-acetylglucosamine synthase-like glycosyltransferase